MANKELGTSGVEIPELGIGTWKYTGGPEPLRRGIELGAWLIDTAEAYGTEGVVGEALRGLRDRAFVATKVSPSHLRHRDVIAAAERSLREMKVDHIDLYQVHWPNRQVPIGETMGALEALVDAGKVRFVGVSNFSVAQLREAQAAMTRHRIASNQVAYSLADRKIEKDLLPYCRASGVTVIAYSPLGGRMDNLRRWDRRCALPRVAASLGKTEAQVALNWCISKRGVVAIPKANSVSRVEENCLAAGWHLPATSCAELESSYRRRTLLEERARRLVGRALLHLGRGA